MPAWRRSEAIAGCEGRCSCSPASCWPGSSACLGGAPSRSRSVAPLHRRSARWRAWSARRPPRLPAAPPNRGPCAARQSAHPRLRVRGISHGAGATSAAGGDGRGAVRRSRGRRHRRHDGPARGALRDARGRAGAARGSHRARGRRAHRSEPGGAARSRPRRDGARRSQVALGAARGGRSHRAASMGLRRGARHRRGHEARRRRSAGAKGRAHARDDPAGVDFERARRCACGRETRTGCCARLGGREPGSQTPKDYEHYVDWATPVERVDGATVMLERVLGVRERYVTSLLGPGGGPLRAAAMEQLGHRPMSRNPRISWPYAAAYSTHASSTKSCSTSPQAARSTVPGVVGLQ